MFMKHLFYTWITKIIVVDLNTICTCPLQVSDFGMSRLKHHTFLSSKSTAGTVIPLILIFFMLTVLLSEMLQTLHMWMSVL
jgi:hypothetical protein